MSKDDPSPTTVRRNKFAPKTLFCIFSKSTGPLLIHRVERRKTIDRQYYIENCLQSVIEEIKKQRSRSGTHAIKFHHDNGGQGGNSGLEVQKYIKVQEYIKVCESSSKCVEV